MNREAELAKLRDRWTQSGWYDLAGDKEAFEADLNGLIDRLVIEGRIAEVKYLHSGYETDPINRIALLSQSSQPLADSQSAEEAKR